MTNLAFCSALLAASAVSFGCANAAQSSSTLAETPNAGVEACGPQSPRDVSQTDGTNAEEVPSGETPNLCNVHFHDPFEHAGFASVPEVESDASGAVCKSVNVGEQVEFHWVYTNCPVPEEPAKGLTNCVCDREDLVLRVFAQAYVVGAEGVMPEQPQGELVDYVGSTTGPSYDNETCSPAKVNWRVNPEVKVLGQNELAKWCNDNPWPGEDHPHESRELVTNPSWLSPM